MKRRVLTALTAVFLLIGSPADAAEEDCNAIVSMSQGFQVYNGTRAGNPPASPLEAATGEQWMMLVSNGKVLQRWTDPAVWDSLTEFHRCGSNDEVDSVVFIFDPFGSGSLTDDGATMRTHLAEVETIVAARFPNAVFYETLLVGSVGHVTCQITNRHGQVLEVRASVTHAARVDQLPATSIGPDLDVPCTGYNDGTGHLNDSGAASANSQLADWFNALTVPTPARFDGFTILSHADQDGCTQENPTPPAWCSGEIVLWHAPYLTVTPYLDNSGWLPGDRSGYGCAYMFLQVDGELIGRVTFAAVKPPRSREPQPGFYGLIKDDGMKEGQRFFGGQLAPPGSNELGDCPGTSLAYESAPTTTDQRPRIIYWFNGEVVEVRDYTTTEAHPDLVFQVVEVTNTPFTVTVPSGSHPVTQRVTVASYLNGVPQVVVYYDTFGNGDLTVS